MLGEAAVNVAQDRAWPHLSKAGDTGAPGDPQRNAAFWYLGMDLDTFGAGAVLATAKLPIHVPVAISRIAMIAGAMGVGIAGARGALALHADGHREAPGAPASKGTRT